VRRFLLSLSLVLIVMMVAASCSPTTTQPTAKPAATTPAPATTIPAPAATSPAPAATPKPAPTATKAPAALPTPDAQHPIAVGEPKAQQSVKSPMRVSGLAQVFEGTVHAEVVDSKGNILGRGFTTASAGGPAVGDFSFDLAFIPPAKDEPGSVRVFSPSPRDGSRLGLVEIPVLLVAK
jgi:hypothetical protein